MVPVLPSSSESPHAAALPAAGLPAEALHSLARAFGREVRVRLPRLLEIVSAVDDDALGGAAGPFGLARTDAHTLAEGCALLGDAAAARSLRHLAGLLADGIDDADPVDSEAMATARGAAAQQAALLLGRWLRSDAD